MIKALIYSVSAFNLLSGVTAECPNACNGHGKCTSYDMCNCNRNWQANDCSERVCQFGLAHVDTPKGDLNHDGVIGGPGDILVQNSFVYPYGTTEQFPRMQNTDLADLTQSAHYYMECSNKGSCNRATGECECYDGYDGAACQRASCPGFPDSCSGHGVCKSIRQLAAADNGNIYELWDKHATMGCECDAGFFGPDCSQRKCKYGVDPLYLDDSATVKYSTFNFAIVSQSATDDDALGDFTDGMADDGDATFAIRFYDIHGEDWLTAPLTYGATCEDVIQALNDLPNDVIEGMTEEMCTKITVYGAAPGVNKDALDPASQWNAAEDTYFTHNRKIYLPMVFWTDGTFTRISSRVTWTDPDGAGPDDPEPEYTQAPLFVAGTVYRIHFFSNPGKLRQPEIDIYLDGNRPTLTDDMGVTVTKVWTDGQQGENIDYVADHCDGVTFTLYRQSRMDVGAATGTDIMDDDDVNGYKYKNRYYSLAQLTSEESNLLKACLGPSDFDASNNVDVYEWDHGDVNFPHFVKIVRTVTTYNDGGYYAALIYNGTNFQLLNTMVSPDSGATDLLTLPIVGDNDQFEIYTTKGTLALTSANSKAFFGFASNEILVGNLDYDDNLGGYTGDLSCENHPDTNADPLVSSDANVDFCLNKGDLFTMFSFEDTQSNPGHLNLYTAEKIYKKQTQHRQEWLNALHADDDKDIDSSNLNHDLEMGTHTIVTDLATNWAQGSDNKANFRIYKFFPDPDSTYEYVAQCSNRGICDESTGLCNCFGGYTSDDCSEQNSLSV